MLARESGRVRTQRTGKLQAEKVIIAEVLNPDGLGVHDAGGSP